MKPNSTECCDKCYTTYTDDDYPTHHVYDACLNPNCECHQNCKECQFEKINGHALTCSMYGKQISVGHQSKEKCEDEDCIREKGHTGFHYAEPPTPTIVNEATATANEISSKLADEGSLEERWEKMLNPQGLPDDIDSAEEWLEDHDKEHLYSNHVYGEPMFDLNGGKILTFIKQEVEKARADERQKVLFECKKAVTCHDCFVALDKIK